jgi:hypothetical protein
MACQTVHNHQTRHQTLTYSFFFNCAPHSNKFFCFALIKTSHCDGDSDGRRNGDGDGRRDDNKTATTVMDGATAMAVAMDGATATQWQGNGNAMATEGLTAMRRLRR